MGSPHSPFSKQKPSNFLLCFSPTVLNPSPTCGFSLLHKSRWSLTPVQDFSIFIWTIVIQKMFNSWVSDLSLNPWLPRHSPSTTLLTLNDLDYVVVPQNQMPFHALMSFLVPIPSLRTSLPPVFTWLPLTHCGGLDDNLLKAYVHVEPVNVTLCGKRVFAHVIKDLKIRPFWITQLGPKSNDKRPYKRGRRDTETASWRHVEAEIGVMLPQTKTCWGHQKLEETRKETSPRSFRGHMALPTPVFWTSSHQNWETVNFHCFKPLLGLWQFAKVARGN